jgi:release factor glutamine methyltransferase
MTALAGSVGEALGAAADALAAAGVDTPRLDAELLLAEALGVDRARLVADPGAGVEPQPARRFGEMVRRRLRREPVAYILGRRGFRRLDLRVDRRVLVPRPETELLVELAHELRPRSVLDVGTGSGAIALAVADELPDCAVTATDTSDAALAVARENAERLGLADRVRFLSGTLPPAESFDLVLANLPYVSEREWPSLQPEVRDWEPPEALLAGPDGLDAIRSLLSSCRSFLRIAEETATSTRGAAGVGDGGALGLEVGAGQAPAVAELMREAGFEETEVGRDLAGIERVVWGRR